MAKREDIKKMIGEIRMYCERHELTEVLIVNDLIHNPNVEFCLKGLERVLNDDAVVSK